MNTNISLVEFHDQTIVAIERDSCHYVAMRNVVENLGLDWSAQTRRIQRHPVLGSTVAMMATVADDGKLREVLTLPLTMLNGWLFGIDANRVRPEIRDRLIQYQTECFDVLYKHFTGQGTAPAQRTNEHRDRLLLVKLAA